jgi:hypothetical protein
MASSLCHSLQQFVRCATFITLRPYSINMLRVVKFLKDFLLFTGILRLLSPFNNMFLFISNFNKLHSFISKNKNGLLINDFYSFKRDYDKRHLLFEKVIAHYQLEKKEIIYLEFGVAHANSFRWWLAHNSNANSKFYGFDTFEGLPEDWGGFFKKGDMSSDIPQLNDNRATFVKGIFQDTLNNFINSNVIELKNKQKIIHMDADLFSSTIFVLSQLYQYLNKGDIILFDEFNVANHEFFAFDILTKAFYVKLKPIAAVNNFYQVAFVVE